MPDRRTAVRLILAGSWLLAAAPVCPSAQAPPPACAHGFEAKIPAGWQSAERLMLHARGLSLPKDQPVVFEFYATGGRGADERLGTYGVVAESPTATGRWHFDPVRVNATRPLRRWLEANPGREAVCIRVATVDGASRPLERLDWTAKAIEIEAVPQP